MDHQKEHNQSLEKSHDNLDKIYKDVISSLSTLHKSYNLTIKDLESKIVELVESKAALYNMTKKCSKLEQSLSSAKSTIKKLCSSSDD